MTHDSGNVGRNGSRRDESKRFGLTRVEPNGYRNHEIESTEDHPFYPVRLRVGRDIVDDEASGNQQHNLVEIEHQTQRTSNPPSEEDEERDPEKHELDGEIYC